MQRKEKAWQVALIDQRRQALLEELSGIAVVLNSNPLTELVIESLAYTVDDEGDVDHFDSNLELIANMLKRLLQIGETLQEGQPREESDDDIPF